MPPKVRLSGHAGRVGAWAVALGVGAAIAAVPGVAFADADGSGGATGSSASSSDSPGAGSGGSSSDSSASASESGGLSAGSDAVSSNSGGDASADADSAAEGADNGDIDTGEDIDAAGITDEPADDALDPDIDGDPHIDGDADKDADQLADAHAGVGTEADGGGASGAVADDGLDAEVVGADKGSGSDEGAVRSSAGGDVPEAASIEWTAALTRRDIADTRSLASLPREVPPGGESADPGVAGRAEVGAASGAGSIVSFLFGNGTAENPNGGMLIGNGFSYDAESCPAITACNGGKGGLLGNGGNGWNGGKGGSSGWVGNGGNGGRGVPGGDGGDGGRGGLLGGGGGEGGAGGAALPLGGTGGSGGTGGNGSYLFGAGGDGGAAGPGGLAGEAGKARILFLFSNDGSPGLDNSLVYFLGETSQTSNTPVGYGLIGEFSASERATLTGEGRIVGESVALKNNSPDDDGYSLWPLIEHLFTSSTPVPESEKLALAQDILSSVQLYPGLGPKDEFPSPAEGTPTAKGGYVFWAQDFEFAPGRTSTDGAYAGVLAVMWAGKQILGDSMKIFPVPASSLFKTLGSDTDGAYNSDHIIKGDGTTPYLTSLGLKGLPTNPAAGSNGEWNFLSLAYANDLIDGFFGQQYNSHFTGEVTPDTLAFYSADLPYALMSSYADPPQVATGGPWNSDYYGDIPFHAGVHWPYDVDPSWGQPPATNQKLKPTLVPLPT